MDNFNKVSVISEGGKEDPISILAIIVCLITDENYTCVVEPDGSA
jgi:hypothetical protein